MMRTWSDGDGRGRLRLLLPGELTAEQVGLYTDIVRDAGVDKGEVVSEDGTLLGPFNSFLTVPSVGVHIRHMARALPRCGALPPMLYETAVLTTGSRWRATYMLEVHRRRGQQAGLTGELIDQLCDPALEELIGPDDISAVWRYCRELVDRRAVSAVTFRCTEDVVGAEGLVLVTMLVGFYSFVGGILAAFEVPGRAVDER